MAETDASNGLPESPFKVGQFVVQHGRSVVQIDGAQHTERGWIYSVRYLGVPSDGGIVAPYYEAGGGAWMPASDFAPVTDPVAVLRCEVTAISWRRQAIDREAKNLERRQESLTTALRCIADAQANKSAA